MTKGKSLSCFVEGQRSNMIKAFCLLLTFDTFKMHSASIVSEISCLHSSDIQMKLIIVTDSVTLLFTIKHHSTNKPPPLPLPP